MSSQIGRSQQVLVHEAGLISLEALRASSSAVPCNEKETAMNTATNEGTPQFPINGLSHVAGWTDIPLSNATIYGLLADTAKAYPGRPAVVFREQGVRWPWGGVGAQ